MRNHSITLVSVPLALHHRRVLLRSVKARAPRASAKVHQCHTREKLSPQAQQEAARVARHAKFGFLVKD